MENTDPDLFLQVAIKIIDKTQLNPTSLQKVGFCIWSFHLYCNLFPFTTSYHKSWMPVLKNVKHCIPCTSLTTVFNNWFCKRCVLSSCSECMYCFTWARMELWTEKMVLLAASFPTSENVCGLVSHPCVSFMLVILLSLQIESVFCPVLLSWPWKRCLWTEGQAVSMPFTQFSAEKVLQFCGITQSMTILVSSF